MWQAEADTELTLSASPATAVGQSKLYPGESRLEYGNRLWNSFFQTFIFVCLCLGPYLEGECMNLKTKPHRQSLVVED